VGPCAWRARRPYYPRFRSSRIRRIEKLSILILTPVNRPVQILGSCCQKNRQVGSEGPGSGPEGLDQAIFY
jgi:hypothetical protein